MKTIRKALAACLIAALVMGPVSALAAGEVSKEEVVYVTLAADGAVEEIHVVNIFDLPRAGQIVDHGIYDELRNMTTTDPIQYDGKTAVIDAGAGRLYYEGKLADTVMPWLVSIQYFMDGRAYTANALAGMSGALEIRLHVAENPRCRGDFFENYALQAVLTMDTAKCENIRTQGATVANVGRDKQLTYTILPGAGADISITADVTDFEMDGVALNGIPLALDVEVDDAELMDKITELLEAIEALDDGAGELSDGMEELQTGSGSLQSGADRLQSGASGLYGGTGALQTGGNQVQAGAGELQSGAAALNEGIRALNDGIAQLQPGLEELNGQSERLRSGSGEILSALEQVRAALDSVDISQDDAALLQAALAGLKTGVDGLMAGLRGIVSAVEELNALHERYEAAIDSLRDVIDGMEAQKAYSTEALEAVWRTLTGINDELGVLLADLAARSDMAEQLEERLTELGETLEKYEDEIQRLPDALGELKAGVDGIVSGYEQLDEGIRAYTDGVAAVTEGFGAVADGASALEDGSGALAAGADTLYGGTKELLKGITSVYNATGTLYDGTGALDSGVAALIAGIAQLYEGAGRMKDGTAAMREETDGMDETVRERIDELLSAFTGEGTAVTSFVSEDNTAVSAVQFVITVPAIEKPAPDAPEPESEQKTSFWQKLIELF